MPRPTEEVRRQMWLGAGDAWTMVTELLTATGVWAAIGFGLDRLFGTWPLLFVIGAFVGHATGIYILWLRTKRTASRLAGRDGGGSPTS